MEIEAEEDGRSEYGLQRDRRERTRMGKGEEGLSRQTGRRNSERENRWEDSEMGRYPRRNRLEAKVERKSEQMESYADILKKLRLILIMKY